MLKLEEIPEGPMLKILSFFILLSSVDPTLAAPAKKCKVYGITDGPQKLTCKFRNQLINLRCVDGRYYLNQKKVRVAYHLDVEAGPSPLVFETSKLNLTLVKESKTLTRARLRTLGKEHFGTCR